nr:carboxy terminal-processing peptidase [uncultured Sediminibacterium sp.]
MKRRKGLILIAVVLFGALFFAFRYTTGGTDVSLSQRQRLLAAVGSLLETQHYSPKNINNDFSKKLFQKFLDQLDNDKSFFLQSDIDALKKHELTLDDEIKGAEIKFAPAVGVIYEKRLAEVTALYKELLNEPFNFTKDESAMLDGSKLPYAANETEQRDRWRKLLKYYTLERYVDLLDQREQNKGKKDFEVKSDAALESEARAQVLKAMNKRFDRIKSTVKEEERFNTFINSVTSLMDPHTDYFAPIEKRSFDEQMSGRFYGIGAQLTEDDFGVKIASVQPGGAAWKSGEIAVNDAILKVAQGPADPVDVAGYATEDVVKLIRGNKGTEVRLTIKKTDGTIKVVTMQRDEIVLDETFARSAIVNEGNKKIGYIWLPEFYADYERENGNRCSEDVAKEIVKLKKENIEGLVIDLRNNGGGSLYEVIQMVGLFINQGPVVQVRDRDGKANVYGDQRPGTLYDGPLAVLVNELSASASEIFAGAIQDYRRGVVIGSTSTYGKGTVQKTVPFGNVVDMNSGRTDMGAVKLTFQMFYRINGGSTQLKGIEPDIVLPDTYEYLKIREKDVPNALPWDQINKATYLTWHKDYGHDLVIQNENERVKQNASLNLLKDNLVWLSKLGEEPASLNINKYRDLQKQIRSTVNQNNTLLRLSQEMSVVPAEVDKDKFFNNPDKNKGERYQAWLRSLKTDMHISETIKVIGGLASEITKATASVH